MFTTVAWAMLGAWLGLPLSKTHSLLAALAGIGFAQGGITALLPTSGNWHDSGWIAVGIGVVIAIGLGFSVSWFIAKVIRRLEWDRKISEDTWRNLQRITVCAVSSGHGFNDGLKYVGIFTLVLFISGVTPEFTVLPGVVFLCAIVMAVGTLVGGWRIHHRLNHMVNHDTSLEEGRDFKPYMGVSAEAVSGFFIWQTGFLGIPTSTNHNVVSAMAGAKSSNGSVHGMSVVKILSGWAVTYVFCSLVAFTVTKLLV
jgi:PiT family inorganic phosphate transporter